MRLDFELSEDEKALRREIIAFARVHLNPGAADRDREQRFDRDLWLKCGELRLQGLVVPAEYGGRGLTPLSTTLAIEALGYGCTDGGLAFALCAHLLACAVPIVRYGTDEQKRRWLPGMSDGSLIAANAMSEPASGSDAFALASHAVADDGGFRLSGHKTFVSNGPVADVFITYAATQPGKGFHGGVTSFVVPASHDGVRTGRAVEKAALRSCMMSDVHFDSVRLGHDAVLGKVDGGAAIFAESMEWERACLVALHVGAMQRILEETAAHAKSRTASGQPIGKFQAVAHRIAEMKVRLEAARLLVYRAATTLGRTRESSMHASIAKLYASEALLASATDAVRSLGGSGILVDSGAERALRDAMAATIYSGTSDIQRNIIARWVGL